MPGAIEATPQSATVRNRSLGARRVLCAANESHVKPTAAPSDYVLALAETVSEARRRRPESRNWRRKDLKRLDSRPEMVWPRTLRTHNIWGAASFIREVPFVSRNRGVNESCVPWSGCCKSPAAATPKAALREPRLSQGLRPEASIASGNGPDARWPPSANQTPSWSCIFDS